MPSEQPMLLIRHAPANPVGFLYGRTDPSANTRNCEAFEELISKIRDFDPGKVISSPAKRCQQTAVRLCEYARLNISISIDEDLWEQDFGSWDGLPFCDVPDIGELTSEELVFYKGHGGESFEDVCYRVWSALEHLEREYVGERLCVVAHAGVLRAVSVYRTNRSMTQALMFNPKPMGWLEI